MDVELIIQIQERYNRLSELESKIEDKMKTLPEGRIYVKQHRKNAYYYLSSDSLGIKEKYINKENSELIEPLLQKKYFEKVLKAARQEMYVLKRIMKSYPECTAEDIYENLPDARKKYVKPIIPTNEEYARRWEARYYMKKPISDDIPIYKTMKGERVRSKSEMIIADRLYINKIPYKYECPIMVKNEIIHPDFTILRISDRKILYLEHCGKMDDPKYAEDMVIRHNNYGMEGIIPGDRLFYTFETSKTPLDVRVLDQMINVLFK